MSFISVYQQAVCREGYHKDAAQAKVVEQLDRLYRDLLDQSAASGKIHEFFSRMIPGQNKRATLYGCYLWGGVGRGKTWLMDLFFQTIPIENKSRFHFHEFMQQIHHRLNGVKGQADPLKSIARDIMQNVRLICLDEFHVSDITDAMLLYGLLDALYQHGVVLLMTSNVMPDDLYNNGLQRSRFEPAIELIKQKNRVVNIQGESDYRLGNGEQNSNYHCPLLQDTDVVLEGQFLALANGAITSGQKILVNSRPIQTRMQADNIVWFDFDAICGGPRAASDYLHLAAHYDYIVISNIYKMHESNDDIARRFINLVDAFYDRNIGIIVSATTLPKGLYVGRRFKQQFQRTVSRLEEIRSKNLLTLDEPQPPIGQSSLFG